MDQQSPPLDAVDESWTTALAVVAHPDDLEYGTAAAVARWTDQGKRVVYCLATSGEAGIDGIAPEQAGPLREAEERAGAALVGVDTVEFLGHPDGMLEYGLPLRRDIARAVRRHRPDVVITLNHHDTWGPGAPNQADHIALGRSVLDGVRDAANRWVFRELMEEELPPWRAERILVAASPEPTHGVEVTATFARGVASLRAHAEYMRGLGSAMPGDPQEFLEPMAGQVGARMGVRYAVSFEVINL
jgi:LmbE family N-acetylglucosaminyl deacetylase